MSFFYKLKVPSVPYFCLSIHQPDFASVSLWSPIAAIDDDGHFPSPRGGREGVDSRSQLLQPPTEALQVLYLCLVGHVLYSRICFAELSERKVLAESDLLVNCHVIHHRYLYFSETVFFRIGPSGNTSMSPELDQRHITSRDLLSTLISVIFCFSCSRLNSSGIAS